MNITIETRETITVYGIRHCGPYPQIHRAFQAIWDWAQAEGITTHIKYGVAIFLDNPKTKAPEQCRSDACVQLDQPLQDEQLSEIVRPVEITGGCYAKYHHTGSYAALETVYDQFYNQWLPQSNYKKTDQPSFEVYLNNPMNTPEDQLLTDIYFPITEK
ncbi:DNA gyrase inhibitor [Pragia fontium]|uniref:AraC effector-binding domain-containing protein n=1 Tax=Pragia fontium TaxID=82985 RepID=A0ABQ5LGN5_9GAMM|nr:GyrI-like domain-containing protein [Pragia fontium]AKJ41973.1 hypothetical protein QQ39_07645 [Pragia fontium]GKX62002.1 hypothetical protein SOASR032_05710 [Pragia fontium]SUB82198.1 DNA gyrase inhibitor [Pragia fontium]